MNPINLPISTERLKLRPWHDDDLEPLVSMGGNPNVMEYFFGLMSREETIAMLERIRKHHIDHGFGYFAVEIPGVTRFAGFIGLGIPRFQASFTPCVEIGWRLAAPFWGYGYATEGAAAILKLGFESLELEEILAMTTTPNWRSRRVMEKLGMQYSPSDDFIHPLAPPNHPFAPHVLYRLTKSDYIARR